MATEQSTIDFLLDQMAGAGNVRARKMFGEYGVYCDEKVVALVCDDHLFVKPSAADKQFRVFYEEAPAYPGAKNYLKVSADKWDDAEWLGDFIRQTVDVLLLPEPKKK